MQHTCDSVIYSFDVTYQSARYLLYNTHDGPIRQVTSCLVAHCRKYKGKKTTLHRDTIKPHTYEEKHCCTHTHADTELDIPSFSDAINLIGNSICLSEQILRRSVNNSIKLIFAEVTID